MSVRRLAGLGRPEHRRNVIRTTNDAVYMNVTVGAENIATVNLFDEFGVALSCPICNTSKASVATMTLFYSNCCGRTACNSCVDTIPGPCTTPGCKGQLSASSWSSVPIDRQRFIREVGCRRRNMACFNLPRELFSSKIEYDNYLEECQDIIYDSTHGNDTIRRRAQQRTEDLKTTYASLISKSREDALRAARSEKLAAASAAAIEATNIALQVQQDTAVKFIQKPDIAQFRLQPTILSSTRRETYVEDIQAVKTASANSNVEEIRDIMEALDGIFLW